MTGGRNQTIFTVLSNHTILWLLCYPSVVTRKCGESCPSPPKSFIKPLVCNLFSRWRNLFMSTASSLHCSCTLWTVPFPFWCFCQSNTSIVEPLNRAILVITAYHFTIGHLIANTVTWLIWIIGPINLAIRIRLWYYCCLLRQFLCQCRWRRTWW